MEVVESERGFVVVAPPPRAVMDRVASVGSTASSVSSWSSSSRALSALTVGSVGGGSPMASSAWEATAGGDSDALVEPRWLERASSLLLCMHRPGRFSVWSEGGMGREVCTIESDVTEAQGHSSSCVGPNSVAVTAYTFRKVGASRAPFLRLSKMPQMCGLSEYFVMTRPDESEVAIVLSSWIPFLGSDMRILVDHGETAVCDVINGSSM